MTLSTETTWMLILLVVGCGAFVWWWARRPYHHHGIRPGEFADFFENLLRDADGSKLIVQDESALHSVVVEKLYSDKQEVVFELKAAVSDEGLSSLQRSLREEGVEASFQASDGSIHFGIRCKLPTDASDGCRALQLVLEWLGSTAASSYHIYFDARPDAEASRERFQRIIDDPAASGLRKQVAVRALETLDKRLEKKERLDPENDREE